MEYSIHIASVLYLLYYGNGDYRVPNPLR